MIRFHPSAATLRDGSFRPLVMVRRDGAMVGSKAAPYETYTTKDAARAVARIAAHRAVAKLAAQGLPSVVA